MHEQQPQPPGPRGLPGIGCLVDFLRDPLSFHVRVQRGYDRIARIPLGPRMLYQVTHPELIEAVWVGKHRDCLRDEVTRELHPLVGKGLLTNEGDSWRRQRRLAAPSFQPKQIADYADRMASASERFFAGIADGTECDMHAALLELTLEIVGDTLLGFRSGVDAERIGHAMEQANAYFERRLFSLWALLPADLPLPAYRRFVRARDTLHGVIDDIIVRARREGSESHHLLGRLIAARDEDGSGMSEAQLRDEGLTMLLAGHETTALSIMYTLFLLCRHPDVAARVRAEIDTELQGRRVRMEDLQRLPQLNAVIKEALRLYPPAPFVGREVAVPIIIDGYELPRGAQIEISPYAVQRDPRFYDAPDAFRPERWLDGSTDDLHRYAFIPFGGGHRVCIGQHFALMESQIVVATLLQQLELTLAPDFEMVLRPVFTMRSRDGLPVRVQRRDRRPAVRAAE